MSDYLLTYYGDDFTGSTDAMEALVLGGIPTVLLLETPEREFIKERFPNVRAVGVAGISRTMTPSQMDVELKPKFASLKALGAPLVHYKVCSTFDSSPTIGSIGHAIEIGRTIFNSSAVPLIVGAPSLKRYVVFGNLFAGVWGQTYRLDRHPTMSKHPVTPMDESDLRVHLGRQTSLKIGLVDILQLSGGKDDLRGSYHTLAEQGCEIILFDTIDNAHLQSVGRLIWENRGTAPVFTVGSSGVEYALTFHWRETGVVQGSIPLEPPGAVDQLVVMCGSAAPTTMRQIEWALENGYAGIRLDSIRLADPAQCDAAREEVVQKARYALGEGKNLVMYSALGPDDPAIAQTRNYMTGQAINAESISALLGRQQGIVLRTILERTGLKRACVAGGDTSGHVAQQLGIFALEILTPIAPGAPLCRASSRHPQFDGLEISFKGGQNGITDYFGAIQRGYA
jgi:uncharacterized protein YgbK (DUF1537 family)